MISVVIPVYNIEEYLPQCIESVIKQTYTELEIILVDDGSTDLSGSICDEYAASDPRICVIHKKNGGLVSARKAGVNAAGGEYITFVDGDDWIEPDTYQKMIENGRDADIIAFACYEEYGDYHTVCGNKIKEGLYRSDADKELLYGSMLMNCNFFEFGISPSLCCKLIRRKILTDNQMKVSCFISYGEDAACTFPCLLDASTVCVINMPLYHYRQRQGSIVKGSAKVPEENFRDIYRLLYDKFESVPMARAQLQKQLHYYMWFILLAKAYGHLGAGMPLFPFPKVRAGARIAVYGAGTFGRTLKEYCDSSADIRVMGWSDLHYATYQKQGLDVISVNELQGMEFDVMVIAILNEKIAEIIKEDFVKKGIPEEKIDWVRQDRLGGMSLPEWVGLA